MTGRVLLLPVLLATVAVAACGGDDRQHRALTIGQARALTQRMVTSVRPDGRVTSWSCPTLSLDFDAQPAYECDAAVTVHDARFHYRVELRRVLHHYRVRFVEVDGPSIERDMRRTLQAVGARISCAPWLDLRGRDTSCEATLRDDMRIRIRMVSTPDGGLRYEPVGKPATMFEQAISMYIAAGATARESVLVSCPEGTTYGRKVRCRGVRVVDDVRYHYRIDVHLGRPGHLFPEGLRIASPDDRTGEVVS